MKAKENLDRKMGQDKLAVGYGDGNNNLQRSFQVLKSHLKENKDDYKNLDEGTKTLINKVVEIESSINFRLSRHIMNRLDIFSRFWFPIIYVPWLNITLFILDQNITRFVILNFLVFAAIFGYCSMKIKQTSDQRKISYWQTVKYYMKFRC